MRLRTPTVPSGEAVERGEGPPGRDLESGARGDDDALRRGRADEGPDGRAAIVRLAAFAPLAAFAAAHWATLVADPPRWRLAGAIAAATLCGGLLVASSRLVARRPLLLVGVRAAAVAVCAVLALLVTGVPFAALAPGGWDELVGGIARGFDGLGGVEWPYAGGDGWVRLTVLLAVPFVGVVTAALAFWPTASGQAGRDAAVARRVAALVVLLTMFAVAAAERPLPAEIGRGVLLLVLLSAWLFLPRLPRARRATALAAAVALLAAGAVSLPLAVALEPDRPWIDYRTWGLWGGAGGAPGRFNWDHSYGPLDWPRTGETMLEVRSRRPHFWRVQALDRFDGYRWRTSGRRRAPGGELPPAGPRLDSRRRERASFTVRGLRSELLATAGTPLAVAGAGVVAIFADGSAQPLGMLPAPGDSYGVEAYVPEPSAATMRAASGPPPGFARDYTQIDLPAPRRFREEGIESAAGAGSLARTLSPPVRVNLGVAGDGVPANPGAEARVLASPYGGVLRLTRRLARGRRTDYDVVKSVERYLRRGYAYSEGPPAREHPLAAFLFEDRIGYCQQFSGAMALMLRMHGIPSRVATGFAPGVRQGRGRWRVRDLDAHSWVEVYFSGLGWVAFDPTPASAPAERPAEDDAEADAAASASGPERDQADPGEPGGAISEERADPAAGPDEETSHGVSGPALALGSLLVLALGAAALRFAAFGRTGGHAAARSPEQDVAELRTALERLGYELSPRTTLSALERTLAARAGPGAARYVRRLRERRFRSADAASAVPRLDRRALRSALVAGRGPLARARGFLALPPAALRARR